MLRGAAFFDLDRTFLRGSSVYALAGAFRQHGVVDGETMVRVAVRQAAFIARGLGLEGVRVATAEGMSRLRGLAPADVRSLVAESFEDMLLPRVYHGALERARRHQAAGEPVYLVSTSLFEIVDEIAAALRLDGAVGSTCELTDGRFTGQPAQIVAGREKVEAVARLAARSWIDLERSTAYSDGASDVPLLAAVGTPVAVNPDRELAGVARARSWPVLRFDATLGGRPAGSRRRRARYGIPLALAAGAAVAASLRRAA